MQPNQSTPTRTEPDLDLDAAVAAVILPICQRLGMRQGWKAQHLHAAMIDMVIFDTHGANEAELLSYGLALIELAKTLKSQHPVDEKTLERMRLAADLADDHLWGAVKIEGESATALEALAEAKEKAAALNVSSARLDRRKARAIRTGRAVSRHQLGLNGAA